MKKLGVIFLATVFVFGLASQVNALDWFDNEAAFDQGEDVISFDSLLRGTEIGATYEGVTFFDLYAEDWISYYVYGQFVGDAMGAGGRSATASNINIYTYGAPPQRL